MYPVTLDWTTSRPLSTKFWRLALCDGVLFRDDGIFGCRLQQEREHNILDEFKECLLPDSNSFGFSTLPSDHLKQEVFPVQGKVFQPLHSTLSLQQDTCLEWAHRRGIHLLCYLDDWVESVPFLLGCQKLLHHCQDLGNVISLEKSDLEAANKAWYLRMLIDTIQERICLTDFWNYQIPGCGGQSSPALVTTFEDVAADSQPHGLLRAVCPRGQGQSAASSVAAEDSLVGLTKQSGYVRKASIEGPVDRNI